VTFGLHFSRRNGEKELFKETFTGSFEIEFSKK
jgi:hypothetical protein